MRKVIGVAGVVTAACALGLATPDGASAVRLARVGAFNCAHVRHCAQERDAGHALRRRARRTGHPLLQGLPPTRSLTSPDASPVATASAGSLSMAFDPGWSSNRRVYFFYTNNDGDLVVARYRANSAGTRIVGSSFHRMLLVEHSTHANHNGGQTRLRPGRKPLCRHRRRGRRAAIPFEAAQKLSSRLGKILRINPSTGAISIFMYGVRNPWRFSFDRANGNFWLGDVGQGTQEEVDFRRASQLSPAHPLERRLGRLRGQGQRDAERLRRRGAEQHGHAGPARPRSTDTREETAPSRAGTSTGDEISGSAAGTSTATTARATSGASGAGPTVA